MKKTLSFLLSFLIVIAYIPLTAVYASAEKWDGSVAVSFAGGDGSKESPYQISNGAELAFFASEVSGGRNFLVDDDHPGAEDNAQYVVLTADIDLNNHPFASIGRENSGYINYFSGCFDGQDHSVIGFSTTGAGFFGGTGDWGITSPERDNGKIKNLHVSGKVSNSGAAYIGGLIGQMQGGTVLNCSFTGTVTFQNSTRGSGFVGGLVGQSEGGLIADCTANATVTGGGRTGGIVGGSQYTSPLINNCINKGNVFGEEVVGGIIGVQRANNPVPVMNCANTGTVTALGPIEYSSNKVGGIAGISSYQILNCYNTGTIANTVQLEDGSIGGIAGEGSVIRNCYNTGLIKITLASEKYVPADVQIGGICGDGPSLDEYAGEQWSDYFSNNAFLQETGCNASYPAFYSWGVSGYSAVNDCTAAMTAEQMKASGFLSTLNAWVDNQDEGDYLKWKAGTPYPVFLRRGEVRDGAASIDADGTTVSVEGTDVLRDGDILDVKPVKQTEAGYRLIADSMKDLSKSILPFDIRLLRAGKPFSPGGEITVSMTVPDGFANPKVAYVSDTGKVTVLESMLNDGVLSFTTDHNSYYVLFDAPAALKDGVVPEAGKTYTISSKRELENLAGIVNGGNACKDVTFLLTDNIVLNPWYLAANSSGTPFYNGLPVSAENKPAAWTPIGSATPEKRFAGTFDGNHHTVSGLYISNSLSNQGLFSVCNNATIKNLGVVNSYIKAGTIVGGIASSNGLLYSGATGDGSITGCYFDGTIVAEQAAGGIVGLIEGTTVSECYNTGTIIASIEAGGIAGASNRNIVNCYNTGTISCTGTHENNSYCGGIVGSIRVSSNGNVKGTIRNCYNIGTVSGENAHALIGVSANTAPAFNCFYLNTLPADEFGAAKTAVQLQDKSCVLVLNGSELSQPDGTGAFIGSRNENDGYPMLRLFHSNHALGAYQVSGDKTTETAVCVYYNCGFTIQKEHNHAGGTADCVGKAVCAACGQSYGGLDPDNHTGGTEVRNQKAADCSAEGYTGDTVCMGCETTLEEGEIIQRAQHSFKNGRCTVCSAADPDSIPSTGDESDVPLAAMLVSVGAIAGVTLIKRNRAKKARL